jgi:hypothetical protein
MKLFVKLMVALLFIALMLPFTILKGPDGKTLMSFSDFSLPDMSFDVPDLPEISSGGGTATLQAGDTIPGADSGIEGKDIFYQWHDSAGDIQFTTEPPPEGIPYTVKGYDPNTNVIQSVKLPQEEPKEVAPKTVDNDGEITNPYDQENIKKLIDDAKNIEKMLDQRFKQQDELLNQ